MLDLSSGFTVTSDTFLAGGEGVLPFGEGIGRGLEPAVQPLGLQDMEGVVAVEVRQEVGDHESEVIEGKVGGPAQGAHDSTLLLGGFPEELVRPYGTVQAVRDTPFAPLADDFGADGRSSAGIWVNMKHALSPSQHGARQLLETARVICDG